MGRIYKRGAVYHAYWTDAQGVAHRRSLRTGDRAVALARLRLAELGQADRAAHDAHTLDEALSAMLATIANVETRGSYTEKARHLKRLLGPHTSLASLTRARIADYFAERAAEGAHPHSVYKESVVLRRALREAIDRGRWAGDVRALVPVVKAQYRPRDRWLTRAEVDALLGALTPKRRLWAAVAVYAGLRDSEIERLQWEHIDLVRGQLRAPGHKTTSAWRNVPIAPQLAELLTEALPDAPRGKVVARWTNVRRGLPRALRRGLHGPIVRRKRGDAQPEILPVTPNDLRRTFASWLVQAGVSHLTVAHLLGHTSTRMVERVYGRLSEDTYRAAIAVTFGNSCTPAAQQIVQTPKNGTRRAIRSVP